MELVTAAANIVGIDIINDIGATQPTMISLLSQTSSKKPDSLLLYQRREQKTVGINKKAPIAGNATAAMFNPIFIPGYPE